MHAKDYQSFLDRKATLVQASGFDVDDEAINSKLFPFQRAIVKWAVKHGRAAIFADTGLGKTAMQVEWARLIGKRALIVAPLSVALQTVEEAKALLGIDVTYARNMREASSTITITNYERIEAFDSAAFEAVVLDESSILKSIDGKTRRYLTDAFRETRFKLACTATPAPNDITEIGRHAEFLGVMSNAEMLATFFINDMKQKDGVYRLKRHAVQKFYRWLASWGMAVKKPSDLGFSDDGYNLPPIHVNSIVVDTEYTPEGMLPGFDALSISAIEARSLRRQTIDARVEIVADMVNNSTEQWVIWAGLNNEAEALATAISDAVNVHGSMSPEEKASAITEFVAGKRRVLVTKTSIAGFGINMQNCHNTVFCGLDYSWESYYQAVRRFYRFGQKSQVNVHIVTSKQELSVLEAVLEKEKEAIKMTTELINHAAKYEREALEGEGTHRHEYQTEDTRGDHYHMMLGDSVERINEIADESVDLSVFSPPFSSLYTYTATERDLGNSRSEDEFFEHFQYIIDGLLRITKQGRNCCVHVQQVAATKTNDGYIGIKDFRGDVIRAFIDAGWVFHGEVTVDKNPQAQAIRTKTKGLMFVQLHKDSAATRPAFGDYLLVFQKPGENAVPIVPDVTNEEWISWAHPVWYDISETKVLNVAVARGQDDERHMCPLQLPLIERCVRLWSNRGETVFSPFAGIGSEGYEAIRHGRRFVGIELKPEYYRVAIRNLEQAQTSAQQGTLFELLMEEA